MNWLSDGCTSEMFLDDPSDYYIKRKEFQNKWNNIANFLTNEDSNKMIPYVPANFKLPFIFNHCMIEVEHEFLSHRGKFDPLVVPIVKYINDVLQVKTISSCQGYCTWGPNIKFIGSIDDALKVRRMFIDWQYSFKERYDYRRTVVNLYSKHENEIMWQIHMMDTVSLIQFNSEYLKIPIEEQIIVPEEYKHLNPGPSLDEWTEITKVT